MKKILIVEDDQPIVRLLKRHLEGASYGVYTTDTAQGARTIISQRRVDLVLLDLMLSDTQDLSFCEELRQQNPFLPIIIISAKNQISEKVQALNSCADDYVDKPFDTGEILARIKVQFQHADSMHAGTVRPPFTAGSLSINFEQRRVTINGQKIYLTPKEYDLLHIFVINEGKVLTYAILLSRIWDDEYTSEYQSIHTHVNRLRRKIEVPAQHRFIFNEPKVGYRFQRSD